MSDPQSPPTGMVTPDAGLNGVSALPMARDKGAFASDTGTPKRGQSISTRAVFTAMATLVSRSANILLLIFLTPFLFAGLGERLFGIYQLTQRISQFGGMTSLGASNYLKIRLAEMSADKGFEDRRKAIGECILQWAALLPLLAVWTVLIYELISGRAVISDSQGLAIIALILLTPLTQVLSIGNIALFTHHLGYAGIPLWTGIGICASAGAAAAAYAGFGIEGVAVALTAGAMVNGVISVALARKLLPWFGTEWPSPRDFLKGFGKSFAASVASIVYLGLQQLEALIFGLGAGPVILARLFLTVIGLQLLDILVRSFLGTGIYAVAPLIRDRESHRIASLRDEAQGNILVLFAVATPLIIGLTPIIVPLWIEGAILLSPWVAAAVLLIVMFRLLAVFDAALLDQARDFHWKNVAAGLVVFAPSAMLGLLVHQGAAPAGWFWLLTLTMAVYFVLVAQRCGRILSVGTAWTPLIIPATGSVVSAIVTSFLLDVEANALTLVGAAAGLSFAIGVVSMLHPRLIGPVRNLLHRILRAARRSA